VRALTAEMAQEISQRNVKPVLMAELQFDSGTLYMWNGNGTLTWEGNDYMGAGNLVGVSSMEETQNIEAKGIICTLSGVPTTLLALTLLERTRGRPFRMWLAAIDDTPVPTLGVKLLTESGDLLLTEDGSVINLEETGVAEFVLLEDGFMLLDENGFRLELESSARPVEIILAENGDKMMTESGFELLLESSGHGLPPDPVVPPWNTLVVSPYRYFTGLMDVMEVNDDGNNAMIRLSVESSMLIGQRSKITRYTAEDQKKNYPDDLGLDFINQLQDKAIVW
jgi:hypothetical protein